MATAMAQIMSVYQYPSRGKGVASYSVGDEKRTAMLSMGEYKWTEMLPAYSGDPMFMISMAERYRSRRNMMVSISGVARNI